ncbi:MATE family efflux transporter [Paenibacillus sp. FSL H8-0332]|uniref:MATE family efflux transporter n=1 Tax=Paenibacillus sp. FSL H8-0332 TaxID=2954742 RepID=UPI0030CC797D
MNNHTDPLGVMPVGKLLLRFSIPAIIGVMVNSIYTLVDRLYVGRLGALAMTGIGLNFPFMSLITAFSFFIGVGASAMISIRLGQNRKEDAEKILGNSFSFLAILMILVSFFGLMFKVPILNLFGASNATIGYASDYITIILYGTIFQGIALGLNNIIRAEGNPTKSMLTMLLGTVLNIILDPIFIFSFDMGIKGAAWATLISQLVSSAWVIAHFVKGNSTLKLRMKNLVPSWRAFKEVASIGLSPFVMQIAATAVAILMNTGLKTYGGDIAIGAMTVINSVMIFFYMPVIGIAQGAQPIIGFNYGAKQYKRVRETLKLEMIIATAICVFAFLCTQFLTVPIIKAFSSETTLIQAASYGMRIMLMMTPLIGFQMVSSQYFQAIGKAKKATILGLLRQVILLVPLLVIMPHLFQLTGVWMASPIADFISCSITGIVLFRELKQLGKMEISSKGKTLVSYQSL